MDIIIAVLRVIVVGTVLESGCRGNFTADGGPSMAFEKAPYIIKGKVPRTLNLPVCRLVSYDSSPSRRAAGTAPIHIPTCKNHVSCV